MPTLTAEETARIDELSCLAAIDLSNDDWDTCPGPRCDGPLESHVHIEKQHVIDQVRAAQEEYARILQRRAAP